MEKEDSSDTRTIDDNHEEEEEPLPIVDEWMKRGEFLRQLRQLELEDQAEREEQNHVDSTQKQQQDAVYTLKNGKSVLVYDSFLQHQRYYDDLKHVDCHYIDYGNVRGDESNNNDCRLVIEQEKSLGKGGLVSMYACCIVGGWLGSFSHSFLSFTFSVGTPLSY